jgi:repressor LexA
VHKTTQVRDGQIVVARLDEEVTVKRLERSGGQIRLIAENPDFEPIIVNPEEVEFAIEGIAVGLIRGAVSKLS